MGRVRSDGYVVDSPHPPSSSSSSSSSTTPHPNGSTATVVPLPLKPPRATVTVRPPPSSGTVRGGNRQHRYAHRRHKRDSGCRNPQVRKGIGSCVFVLGIPCLIAGLILTIVSSTDDEGADGRKYPSSFPVLGPVLIALSVVCFLIGVLLYNVAILRRTRDCLGLSEKDSLCRRLFPRLSAWLKPDLTQARTQTAINNLQTAPARSAMRKMPNPDLLATATHNPEQGQGHPQGHHHGHHHHHHHGNDNSHSHGQAPSRRKRAVTFSHSDGSLEGGFVAIRLNSVSSEQDRSSVHSENGGGSSLNGLSPSSSLLSLRNCRIHPKDDVFWTESSAGDKGAGEEDGGGVDSEGHDPITTSDLSQQHVREGGGGDDDGGEGGGGGDVGVELTDIEEEGV